MKAKGASCATKSRVKSALDIDFERKIENYHREYGIGNYSAASTVAGGRLNVMEPHPKAAGTAHTTIKAHPPATHLPGKLLSRLEIPSLPKRI